MNRSIESVLIPTDGSDGALAGAKHGLALASTVGADVSTISVVDTTEADAPERMLAAEEDSPFERSAEEAVETVAALAADVDADLEVETVVERGAPSRVIESYADEQGIDVVAMGTEGRTGLERALLGSVTENVLRTVSVPVLAVPPASPEPTGDGGYGSVLLPTDGSEPATVAVEWGIALAETYDATGHAIYSADTSRLLTGDGVDELFAALEQRGEDALATVRERATEAGVSVRGTLASGPPARVILEYVDDNDIDFVVMGTHGRSGIRRRLLGSVTENVVRNADVPVFCVPAGGDE
ncbi:universal stress protein [Natrialbaceae archaeon AArc-T1-2]|uniref:universal stress protein n=1 Tax=Natrialbaceae archaeon AArc-T1-2 TaxID=3053904 RepID=UPI00255A7EA8|nr:universal stress protein [Natrialbaceae archaeon AArc-T1-2]WIV66911.1 universal stress protein [Natrialbaceae archaeon AArc-T1-2]